MNYDQVVFAGGGNRCFWQAGFWQSISPELTQQPDTVASVSAGSAMACAVLMGTIEATLDATTEVMARNQKNRYWKNLFTQETVHPHAQLYREIIHKAISDEDVLKLQTSPKNLIALSRIPAYLGPRSATLAGIIAYQIEKKTTHPVHPKLGKKLGFRPQYVEAQSCKNVDELADLILGSSCTPPFTPIIYRENAPVLDGGMVDNVPLDAVAHLPGRKLILLSRRYKTLPHSTRLRYVQPSKPVASNAWDYTNADAVKETYLQGQEDGYRFLENQNMR